MRTITPDPHGVYVITDLQPPAPRSPVEPDPLRPPTVNIPRWRFDDPPAEQFRTVQMDDLIHHLNLNLGRADR